MIAQIIAKSVLVWTLRKDFKRLGADHMKFLQMLVPAEETIMK
jgi:hypothetical protein